jgi:hypothetical protein
MALDESTDNLVKLENNGIVAYIDGNLRDSLQQFGAINIDFVTQPDGQGGYMIRAGQPGDCEPGSCKGC